MKRHEAWRYRYRQARDLDHLSVEELSERLHDCMNNIRTRTPKGKVGVLSPADRIGETWTVLFTEILEECSLRGYDYPGPMNISRFRSAMDHAFDPIPDMDRLITRHNLERRPYLLKFGSIQWISKSIEYGTFRICSASYYDSDEHNHARRDKEMQRCFKLNPRNKDFAKWPATDGCASITAASDYYLFSLTEIYNSRLFGDFAANSCLVIFDKKKFLFRLQRAVATQLPGWQIQVSRVNYYDPVRINPANITVPNFKPFKHAYQEELRLLCLPPTPVSELPPFEVKLGPLDDCATLADLTTCPPPVLPHDPYDDPIQTFGTCKSEENIVNHLPDAAKIQGLMLNKGATRHEDWTFQMQYTDSAGEWHEVKMPMLDGLYLLNMLRKAEEEQHLGLWNRK